MFFDRNKHRDFPSMYPVDHGNKQAVKGRESVFEFLEVRNVAEEVVLSGEKVIHFVSNGIYYFFLLSTHSLRFIDFTGTGWYYGIMSVLCVWPVLFAGNTRCWCTRFVADIHTIHRMIHGSFGFPILQDP